jgi:hypothetical protein
VITSTGTILATLTLDLSKNYVVTAGVTALSDQVDSMQCQLLNNIDDSWDDMGETSLAVRATVPLEHAYPVRSPGFGTYSVSVGCISNSTNYIVDTGHLYVWEVGSINPTSGHVIYRTAKSLEWVEGN